MSGQNAGSVTGRRARNFFLYPTRQKCLVIKNGDFKRVLYADTIELIFDLSVDQGLSGALVSPRN